MVPKLLLCFLLQASIWTVYAVWTGPEYRARVPGKATDYGVVPINSSTGEIKFQTPLEGATIEKELGMLQLVEVQMRTNYWYKIMPTALDLERTTLSYAVILHNIHVKTLPSELDLKTVLTELQHPSLGSLVVEQRNALGESRWFLIRNPEFELYSARQWIEGGWETRVSLMPKDTYSKVQDSLQLDGRIDSLLTIRVKSVSNAVPKRSHVAEYMLITGILLEGYGDQAIYIKKSDSDPRSFKAVVSFCEELLHNVENTSSNSNNVQKESTAEIEFQPRVGSNAIPSSWIRLLGLTEFNFVNAPQTGGDEVNVLGIKIYFSGLDKPIVSQTIAENSNSLENKLKKKIKVIFELEFNNDWKGNPEIIEATIDWVSGNVQFTSENLQFIKTILSNTSTSRRDSADNLRKQILEGNVQATIFETSGTGSQFTLSGLKNFVYGEIISSFSFSSCKLFSHSPDAYFWWLEGEKKAFEGKWGLETSESTVQFNKFAHQGVLGEGTTAVVTLAKFQDTYYAMKSVDISVENLDIQEIQERRNEATILQAIHFKFLVSLMFYFNGENYMHFIMNFVPGGELFYLLVAEGLFSEDTCRFYGAQIVLALEYLHKNDIVYRDLKPENIMIDANGYLKLADLGLAVKLETNGRTTSGYGTARYMAPEAFFEGDIGCGKGVDSWSLGVALYEMLTGDLPFFDEDTERLYRKVLNPDEKVEYPDTVSPEARSLLERLLERNVLERLTIEDVKKDPWFSVVDWDSIYNMKVEAPYTPIIDPTNFRKHFTQKAETMDEVEVTVRNFDLFWNKRPENIIW